MTEPPAGPGVVNDLNLTSYVKAPVKNAAPAASLSGSPSQYSGAIVWKTEGTTVAAGAKFEAGKVYTAEVTLTAAADTDSSENNNGFTFTGVGANAFTYTGATTVTNLEGSTAATLVVTITFPAVAAEGGGNNPPPSGALTWTLLDDDPFGGRTIRGIVWGGAQGSEKFIAFGPAGKMATSPDGINWTPVANTTFDSTVDIMDIAWGGGKFVAVADSGDDRIATSPDGTTWTAVTITDNLSALKTFGIFSVSWGNGKFIALANNQRTAYSTDGITWTNTGLSNAYDLVWGGDKFVAITANKTVETSPDGATWTEVESPWPEGGVIPDIKAVAYGDGMFVAGGEYGMIATSPDGTTWTKAASPWTGVDVATTPEINGIAYGGGKFVVVGPDGKAAYSTQE